jgi:hypothetical protein
VCIPPGPLSFPVIPPQFPLLKACSCHHTHKRAHYWPCSWLVIPLAAPTFHLDFLAKLYLPMPQLPFPSLPFSFPSRSFLLPLPGASCVLRPVSCPPASHPPCFAFCLFFSSFHSLCAPSSLQLQSAKPPNHFYLGAFGYSSRRVPSIHYLL